MRCQFSFVRHCGFSGDESTLDHSWMVRSSTSRLLLYVRSERVSTTSANNSQSEGTAWVFEAKLPLGSSDKIAAGTSNLRPQHRLL